MYIYIMMYFSTGIKYVGSMRVILHPTAFEALRARGIAS